MSTTEKQNVQFSFNSPMNEVAIQINKSLNRFTPTSFSFKKTNQGVRAILKAKETIIAHTYL